MSIKRKTLPRKFAEICERGDLQELIEVYQKCDLEAYTGYNKETAFSVFGIPEHFITWLTAQGADINAKDTYQRTALYHHAAYWKSSAEALLKAGADVSLADYQINTPLHNAVATGKTETVKILLGYGAEADALNGIGQTPLEKGLHQCRNADLIEMAEITELLLSAGAQKTETMAASVTELGKTFEFYRSSFHPDYLEASEAALMKLYQIFDADPADRRREHDGRSPITVEPAAWEEQHEALWALLVPGSGACKTVQGEVIRVTGKVSDEIFRNGGGNWDRQFSAMVKALPRYFRMGHPLAKNVLLETEQIVKAVVMQEGDEQLARISELAVQWVIQNPTPITLISPSYRR